jgi:acyl-CoA reductase-like NAD-dependent aldehyde dehydrogenase
MQTYKLGDPTHPDTNLGPVVSLVSAHRIQKQIADAGEDLCRYAAYTY